MSAYPGTPVKPGDSGPAVLEVQHALGVEETGLFGPTTESTVCRYQRTHALGVTGIVGPDTWAELFTPHAPPGGFAAEILKAALGYVGQEEEPKGSNRGPFVDQCNISCGVPLGSPWCVAFIYFCARQVARDSGIQNPMPQTGSAHVLFEMMREARKLVTPPLPGDIGLCRGGETGHYHGVIIATAPAAGRVQTVEGNSNQDGSPEGFEVVHRSPGRLVSTMDFVRI